MYTDPQKVSLALDPSSSESDKTMARQRGVSTLAQREMTYTRRTAPLFCCLLTRLTYIVRRI